MNQNRNKVIQVKTIERADLAIIIAGRMDSEELRTVKRNCFVIHRLDEYVEEDGGRGVHFGWVFPFQSFDVHESEKRLFALAAAKMSISAANVERLIDETLKMQEAERLEINISQADIDQGFAAMENGG